MKIVVLSYSDMDVTDGISDLIHTYPEAGILLPIEGFREVEASVIQMAEVHEVETALVARDLNELPPPPVPGIDLPWLHTRLGVVTPFPHDEAVRSITHGDAVAIAWTVDDIEAVERDRAYLEDFAITLWDITDGLTQVQGPLIDDHQEQDEAELELQEATEEFARKLANFITAQVRSMVEHHVSGQQEPDADA